MVYLKQFQINLQAFGWDIPLLAVDDKTSGRSQPLDGTGPLTTGFSGTNDRKRIFPLTIHQCDLLGLANTNLEIMATLRHPIMEDIYLRGLSLR
jgi:hypothetical protein